MNGIDILHLAVILAAAACLVVPADIVSVNSDTLEALGLTVPESLSALGEVQYLTSK